MALVVFFVELVHGKEREGRPWMGEAMLNLKEVTKSEERFVHIQINRQTHLKLLLVRTTSGQKNTRATCLLNLSFEITCRGH